MIDDALTLASSLSGEMGRGRLSRVREGAVLLTSRASGACRSGDGRVGHTRGLRRPRLAPDLRLTDLRLTVQQSTSWCLGGIQDDRSQRRAPGQERGRSRARSLVLGIALTPRQEFEHGCLVVSVELKEIVRP